jgi:hypothetical protein
MTPAESLPFAIVGHLVGDYILQNDFLANGKKKSTLICALHCLLWTLAVVAFAGWWVWWIPIVLFITHFAQDRTTFVRWWMGKVGQNGFATHLAPWSIIAVDNVMHIVVLAVIARVLH